MKKKHWIIIIVIVVVLAAIWYFCSRKKTAESNYATGGGCAEPCECWDWKFSKSCKCCKGNKLNTKRGQESSYRSKLPDCNNISASDATNKPCINFNKQVQY